MIACDAHGCVRGVVRSGDWGDPCTFCGGTGTISLAELCRRLGEQPSTVKKLLKPHRKMRTKVAARILDKLLEMTK